MPGRGPARGSKRLLALRGDAQLVARVRAGDALAFEVLYARHLPGVLSFCRHMLGSRDEAEDAVQMVFVAAHRQLAADDRDINLKPWLYAIARNRCLSILRARRDVGRGEVEISTEGLPDVAQRRADLRALLTDLQDLPEEQRSALVLTELGDLSHAEVARVLECEPGQVKGLVFRARSGLVERRDAREAACEEIRVELANATGGGLRRGRLRHHLKACSGCSSYLADLRRQRKMLSLVLPVAPTLGLKSTVLGALGGGSTAGAGAATALTAGGAASLGAATAVKLAVAGVLVSGAGVAAVVGDRDSDPAPPPSEGSVQRDGGRPQARDKPVVTPPVVEGDAGQRRSGPEAQGRRLDRRREGAERPPASSLEAPAARGPGHSGTPGTPGNGRFGAGKPSEPPGQTGPRVKSGPSPPARGREGSTPERGRSEAAPRRGSPAGRPKPKERTPRRVHPEAAVPDTALLPE